MDNVMVDSDLKKRFVVFCLFVFVRACFFLGVIENSELCINKQLNQVSFTFQLHWRNILLNLCTGESPKELLTESWNKETSSPHF